MFGRRKINAEESVTEKRTPEKGQIKQYLDTLSFLSSFVMDKKEALVEEELKTIREIDKVKDSYTEVIEHNAAVSDAVDAFQSEFERIGGISGQFNEVISGVEDVHRGINEVVGHCTSKVEQLQSNMGAHERRYEQVQMNIDGLKSLMTQKGFIYEDISNMMEQAQPLIQNIQKEL